MPVTASDPRSEPPSGLSRRMQDLWLAALSHRRRADDLAAADKRMLSL